MIVCALIFSLFSLLFPISIANIAISIVPHHIHCEQPLTWKLIFISWVQYPSKSNYSLSPVFEIDSVEIWLRCAANNLLGF